LSFNIQSISLNSIMGFEPTTLKNNFQFMNNDLLNGLYWSDNTDDGSQRNYLCPTGNETAGRCPVSATDKIILYGNFMIGVPRYFLSSPNVILKFSKSEFTVTLKTQVFFIYYFIFIILLL
jgi:hypothetical protein